VERQQGDPRSFLSLTRALITLRRQSSALQLGQYCSLYAPGNIYCYRRFDDCEDFLIALNLDSSFTQWKLPVEYRNRSTVLLSTAMDRRGGRLGEDLQMRPNEGLILRLLGPPPS
jgi:alpha-glucosidase